VKRIRFLYTDHDHAIPLLRARDYLKTKYGFELEPTCTNSIEEVLRYATDPLDGILLHHQLASDEVFECHRPVMLLERIDGAQLESRHWMAQVAGVVKAYCLEPRELHNRYKGRVSAHLLRAAGVVAENSCAWQEFPQPQLSSDQLAKIHLGYGFGAYAKMDRPRQQLVDFSSPREHDCCFHGYVEYDKTEMECHRRAGLAAVEALQTRFNAPCGPGRPLRPDEYLATMFRSKSVLSPWGWGEAAHRDYEAMLLGAVLIKPDMAHVACWPNVYVPNETYLPCRLDFADLPDIVGRIAADWGAFRPMRERARELALAAGDPARVARRFADIFEACGC